MQNYIYVVLTKPNTIISRIIQLIKKDEYTHAAVSLDKNLHHMYSFGRKYDLNPFHGSFKQEDINKGIYRLYNTLPGIIIGVKVSEQQYEKAQSLINHFISNSKLYKYNYKGLIYNMFNKSACCQNRFLCSEFVNYILKECGIDDIKLPGNLVRPQNLVKIEGDIIYKGNLKEPETENIKDFQTQKPKKLSPVLLKNY